MTAKTFVLSGVTFVAETVPGKIPMVRVTAPWGDAASTQLGDGPFNFIANSLARRLIQKRKA